MIPHLHGRDLKSKPAINPIALFLYCLLLQPFTPLVAAIPSLIDVVVVNTPAGFALVPSELNFQQHQDYLFVITNDNSESLIFHFSQFGQKIITHYLQGTSSVSQQSIDLPSKSKVLWQFSTQESGEFDYYISYPSQNIRGLTYKMTIHPLQVQETPVKKTPEEVVAVNIPTPVKTEVNVENVATTLSKTEKRKTPRFGRK